MKKFQKKKKRIKRARRSAVEERSARTTEEVQRTITTAGAIYNNCNLPQLLPLPRDVSVVLRAYSSYCTIDQRKRLKKKDKRSHVVQLLLAGVVDQRQDKKPIPGVVLSSSQAMATLSSDLKDFTAIIQEDVAEVATTVRKTVQEKSEAMRQRAEEDATKEHSEEDGEANTTTSVDDDQAEGKPRAVSTASSTTSTEDVKSEQQTASSKINSIFSSIGGYTLETSFGKLNFGEVGSKLLHTADGLLGSLAGEHESGDEEEDERAKENTLAARRFRLLALQEDSETYVEPPLDVETFAKWKASTPSEELETVKAEVLEHYPAVVAKFSELVPSVVEADDFWSHYIYKASLLAAQEQRGADLLEHALNDSEEEIGWDVDSPRNDDSERKKAASGSFFAEEETKEDGRDVPSQPVAVPADVDAPSKPDSSSSDGESWIELDERKDQQAPLSSSSVASSVYEVKPASAAAATASSAKEKTSASVAASGDDEEEELDWGDDDLIPEEVLSGDEASTAAGAPAFHEEPKKRAGDWGEWD